MRLDNPAAIINMILTLQSLDLQRSRRVETQSGTCCDTCDLFDVAPQEGIARAWIRCESNPAVYLLTVEEAELFVKNPVVFLVLSLVTTGQHIF